MASERLPRAFDELMTEEASHDFEGNEEDHGHFKHDFPFRLHEVGNHVDALVNDLRLIFDRALTHIDLEHEL
jgi:hypothetical protein